MRIDAVNSFLSSSPIWDIYSVPSVTRPEGEPEKVLINRPDKAISLPQRQVDTCSKALPSDLICISLPAISKLSAGEIKALENHIARQILMLNLLKI